MDLSSYDRNDGFMRGLDARRRVLGDAYVGPSIAKGAEDAFTHQLQQFVTEYCWGTVWNRDGLPDGTRSIINLTMLAALGRTHELRLHTRGAINNGVTKEQIAEVFLQVGVYAGVPAAVEAFREASKVFEEMGV